MHLSHTQEKSFDRFQQKVKGQLISKCLFGSFISPKKRTKKFNFTTMVPQVELFSFFGRIEDTMKTPKLERHFEIN